MLPANEFRDQPPEFWALVKLISQELGYSLRATRTSPSHVRAYTTDDITSALRGRGLDPAKHELLTEEAAGYSEVRAAILQRDAEPNLMDREQAKKLFEELRELTNPPVELLPMNKQRGEKRHFAYLTCIVNMLTWSTLLKKHGEARFNWNPRKPLTFSRDGMPLRTLFRWMDGAYPELNHPLAAWEIKEYYGTTTFGSRVADGVYETALDGYELNELRDVGVEVHHYLFLDDRFTWWDCGKSYLCRIVDMLHIGLLDGAFVGREAISHWPTIVDGWPASPGQ
jgi:hypothetical protein